MPTEEIPNVPVAFLPPARHMIESNPYRILQISRAFPAETPVVPFMIPLPLNI